MYFSATPLWDIVLRNRELENQVRISPPWRHCHWFLAPCYFFWASNSALFFFLGKGSTLNIKTLAGKKKRIGIVQEILLSSYPEMLSNETECVSSFCPSMFIHYFIQQNLECTLVKNWRTLVKSWWAKLDCLGFDASSVTYELWDLGPATSLFYASVTSSLSRVNSKMDFMRLLGLNELM